MLDVFSKIGDAVGGLVTGIFSGIDSISTTQEEKDKIKLEVEKVQTAFMLQMATLKNDVVKEQAAIIRAEVGKGNWLTASWRPILMLTFGFVILYSVVAPSFGAPPIDMTQIPDRFWGLVTVGVGGYVGGRTLEKVTPAIVDGLKAKRDA
jgi:hypothetical protein